MNLQCVCMCTAASPRRGSFKNISLYCYGMRRVLIYYSSYIVNLLFTLPLLPSTTSNAMIAVRTLPRLLLPPCSLNNCNLLCEVLFNCSVSPPQRKSCSAYFLEFLIKDYKPQSLGHLNWDSSGFWIPPPALLCCLET